MMMMMTMTTIHLLFRRFVLDLLNPLPEKRKKRKKEERKMKKVTMTKMMMMKKRMKKRVKREWDEVC